MKKYLFYEKLEQLFPGNCAVHSDHFGIQIETTRAEIHRILIALDLNEDTVIEADRNNCDLILTHHPLFFNRLENILLDSTGRLIRLLTEKDIGLYSIHSNFDAQSKIWLKLLKFKNTEYIEKTCDNAGLGYFGRLREQIKFYDLVEYLKKILKVKYLRYIGKETNFVISTVAICPGSGMSLLTSVISLGPDIFLTGDVKYHDALYAYRNDLKILDIGHHNSEIVYKREMAEILSPFIKILISGSDEDPFEVV